MIIVIHGDDISNSREYFSELKKKYKDFVLFDGNKLSITDLVQSIDGSSLFGDTKAILIEGFLIRYRKTDKESKGILDFINENSKSPTFVLWEPKEILKKDLLSLKDFTAKLFKLPRNIFLFLDGLKPNNSKNLLNLFHEAIESGIKEEMIVFMLQRQIRILLALSERGDNGSIEEIKRFAPWQMEKMERQAKLFDFRTLRKIYRKLFEIELAQKTGGLSLSLVQSIDILLLEM